MSTSASNARVLETHSRGDYPTTRVGICAQVQEALEATGGICSGVGNITQSIREFTDPDGRKIEGVLDYARVLFLGEKHFRESDYADYRANPEAHNAGFAATGTAVGAISATGGVLAYRAVVALAARFGTTRVAAGSGGAGNQLENKLESYQDKFEDFLGGHDPNPTNCLTNCVNTSLATDSTLAGAPASALPSGPTPATAILEDLAKRGINTQFVGGDEGSLVNSLLIQGEGSRGIFVGTSPQGEHAFTGVVRGGVVHFLDGQKREMLDISQYKNLWLAITAQGEQ